MIRPVVFFLCLVVSIFAYQNCTTDITSVNHASSMPFMITPGCIDDSKAVTLNVASLLDDTFFQCKRTVPIADTQFLDCGGITLDNDGSNTYPIGDSGILFNNLDKEHYKFFIRSVQLVDGTRKFGQEYEVDMKKCGT